MNAATLTAPERAAERVRAKRIRSEVFRRGGCGCCRHRDPAVQGWGHGVCGQPGRAFPRCLSDAMYPAFVLDRDTLEDA